MVEETLTVGDMEVVIRETDDCFEVEEAEEETEGTYIRFESNNRNPYGCEIPIGSEFDVRDLGYKMYVGWHQDDNISFMNQQGAREMQTPDGKGYDGYAVVDPDRTEIVQY